MILGAGAVGGTIGGLLRRKGSEVVLLARGEHARVMKESGLTLATPTGTHAVDVDVAASPQELELRADDVLIITTKTQHTQALLDEVAALPVRGDGAWSTASEKLPVVCAQNGVENERIALRRFAQVYGICVMLPAAHLEPGRVESQGSPYPGMLDVGRYPSGVDAVAEEVAFDLTEAGFLSIARAEVMRWKYAKLLLNLANSLEALSGHNSADKLFGELVKMAMDEGRSVLAAAGIDVVTPEEWKAYRSRSVEIVAVDGRPRAGGSSWQSATRGTGSIESDFLNGEMVLLGRLHGVATPVNELLRQEANALARERRPAGSVAPSQLLSRLGV
ncbi:MAG: panE [Mycobacterium sp.]|nr:panE [Mycobacterium sp.]